MDTDLLTKVLTHVNISASGPKVLSTTILVVHYYNFEVTEKFGDNLNDVKLSNFTVEYIHDCCTVQ